MEAPEKIYRTTTYLDNNRGKTVWKITPVKGAENIEYTCTDSFIEKACEWLKNNASNYIIEHPFSSYVYFVEDQMIEDFKKYVKGE